MTTSTLELGTGVCLVPQRDPIALAKSVASLDQLSGGRFLFGIGGGWNREELEHHGVSWERRFRIMRERVEAMQAIWTQEEASYSGEFVNFEKIWSWPKPMRKPHPPLIVGGYGAHTLKRVVRYGDEWMPTVSQGTTGFAERIQELQRLAADAGRGPIPVGLYRAPTDTADLRQLQDIGISRVVFLVPPGQPDTVLPELDRLAGVMRGFGSA
jgi:probable F420-dependent oxidoreductase